MGTLKSSFSWGHTLHLKPKASHRSLLNSLKSSRPLPATPDLSWTHTDHLDSKSPKTSTNWLQRRLLNPAFSSVSKPGTCCCLYIKLTLITVKYLDYVLIAFVWYCIVPRKIKSSSISHDDVQHSFFFLYSWSFIKVASKIMSFNRARLSSGINKQHHRLVSLNYHIVDLQLKLPMSCCVCEVFLFFVFFLHKVSVHPWEILFFFSCVVQLIITLLPTVRFLLVAKLRSAFISHPVFAKTGSVEWKPATEPSSQSDVDL